MGEPPDIGKCAGSAVWRTGAAASKRSGNQADNVLAGISSGLRERSMK